MLFAETPPSDWGGLQTMAYIIAGICFILSLGGLSQHESARRGNSLGIVGIVTAIAATLLTFTGNPIVLALTVGVGTLVGVVLALKVDMTAMPQLVAVLHSFVGLAAVFVGISNYLAYDKIDLNGQNTAVVKVDDSANDAVSDADNGAIERTSSQSSARLIHLIEVFLGVFIGALTFTGSVVAWGKLQGVIGSKPWLIPGRHWANLGMLLVTFLLGVWFLYTSSLAMGATLLILMTLISFALGIHMVMAIGGADMPVVVSMLNSYSGWAAAATGFMLPNDLLIITGALVGSSGAILSYIMCHAMNRSFVSVILGGFGTESGTAAKKKDGQDLTYQSTSIKDAAGILTESQRVIVVPGYGMAVAQAQHPIREISEILKKKGIDTRFAIHPVAGRLPGHMNVLLAEAKVPYDVVLEMEEINEDFPETDTVLVIGANDIVNPGALDDPESPIYGMPVLEAWKSSTVIVLKRSMATGYSGIDNPLFYNTNTEMLFGDAKDSVDGILQHLRNGSA